MPDNPHLCYHLLPTPYSLHARWCIIPWCTISVCLWLLLLHLPCCIYIVCFFLYISTVLLQVVFGNLTFRCPSGCHVKAVIQITRLSMRKTWHIHLHLFCIILSLAFVVSDIGCNSWFAIVSVHRILSICPRLLFWNVYCFFFFALLFSSFHCRKLELISLDYLKGWFLSLWKISRSSTFFLRLLSWPFAFPRLFLMSSSQPSLDDTTPPW